MQHLNRFIPGIAAIVLMLGAALVQGVISERWETFPELQIFADQLKKVPLVLGGWNGTDAPPKPEDKNIMEIAGAVGSLARVYQNERGEMVTINLVCGRLSDVAFHTPDRCYPHAGFEKTSEITQQIFSVGKDKPQFLTTTFMKSLPGGNERVRVYWSWSATGDWIATEDDLKWNFAGQRALYKLYVITRDTGSESSETRNPAVDFIHDLIPELDKAFRPAFDKNPKPKAAIAPSAASTSAQHLTDK